MLHILKVFPVTVQSIFIDFTANMAAPFPTHTGSLFLWQIQLYCISQGKCPPRHCWKYNPDVIISIFYSENTTLCFVENSVSVAADSDSTLAESCTGECSPPVLSPLNKKHTFSKWSKGQLLWMLCLCLLIVALQGSRQCPLGWPENG